MAMLMTAKRRIQAIQIGITIASIFTKTARAGDYNRPLYNRLRNSKLSVDETMNEWINQGITITAADVGKLIPKFARSEYRNKSLQLIEWMENKGMDINPSIKARQISLISQIKGIEFAEQKFYSLPNNAKNEQTYGALLGSYCKEKMEDKASALFAKMNESNFANLVSYNLIMTLYTDLDNPQMVHAYFQRMRSDKITPDKFALNSLLYLSITNTISVETIFEVISEKKFSVYVEVASYFNSKGAYDKSIATLKMAEEIKDKKDKNHFYALMRLYAEAGNEIETLKVWSSLNDSFEILSNGCFYNFLLALRKLGDINGMREFFDQWETKCVKFDAGFLDLMVDSYLEKEMIQEAECLRRKVIERRGALC